jgi:lipoate-protein ligase A
MYYLIDNLDHQDPALNLALEEYAVRNLNINHEYALLYVNSPCIIIGRHQNAFEEINYPHILQNNFPVYRRISGGGTVYHDPGNLNFSFITRYDKKKFNNYAFFNRTILETLQSLHVPAELNKRNDIVIEEKKISGNAQFTSLDRMVSHGTLLFKADLRKLHDSLQPPSYNVTSRSIKSVRSAVTNISGYLAAESDISTFKEAIAQNIFGQQIRVENYSFSPAEWEQIQQLAETKYRQWDWNFGESPLFQLEIRRQRGEKVTLLSLKVKHGKIEKLDFQGKDFTEIQIQLLQEKLSGTRFTPGEVRSHLDKIHGGIDMEVFLELLFAP